MDFAHIPHFFRIFGVISIKLSTSKGHNMKTLLGSILAFALFFASFDTIQAQSSTHLGPAVAFVKASRDTLFIQPLSVDSPVQAYDLPSLFTNFTNGAVTINSIKNLAVIGMTPAGDRLVIAGTVNYINPSNSTNVTFQGLLSIPWPITTFTLTNSVDFLLPANENDFRPIGILSADGKQWWITFTTTTGGNDPLTFYHGNTDGSGSIDSTTEFEMEEGFQMSNITLDRSNNFILASTTYDKVLDNSQVTDGRFLLHVWEAGHGDDAAIDLSGAYDGLALNAGYYQQYDSIFGLTIIPQNDGHNALLGLTSNPIDSKTSVHDNSINFYTDPYGSSGGGLSGSNESTTISMPSSILPSGEDFFSGQSCGTYQEQLYAPGKGQMGEAGDVSLNTIGGDSVLFVTHESPEDCANRGAKSGIYFYDVTSGLASATLVYNDTKAQELQPVWVVAPYLNAVAPISYPGIAWQTSNSGNFGSVDTGSISSPMNFTFIDTSSKAVTLDSATITGPNASEFKINSGHVAGTLPSLATQSINVTFTPVAPAGAANATLNVYFEGQTPNLSITQALSGTVVIPAGGGVKEDAVLASSLTIDPNPFSSSASVQLTSPDAGAMSIVVHDALGRTVYTSDLRETGAGQTESFTFGAKSLGLPDGVYYVTAFLGERQASRAVVFVR